MSDIRTIFANISIDATRFAYQMRRLGLAFAKQPVPPIRRSHFEGTAREYRAARRAYSRKVRAHRKAGK